MAEKEVCVKVRLRTDSAVNWLNANPILLKGEIGIEEDMGRIKIGNGKSPWAVLPYFAVEMRKQEWERISAEDISALYYWERKK